MPKRFSVTSHFCTEVLLFDLSVKGRVKKQTKTLYYISSQAYKKYPYVITVGFLFDRIYSENYWQYFLEHFKRMSNKIFLFFVFLFLATPCGLQDPNLLTRDQTHALGSEGAES